MKQKRIKRWLVPSANLDQAINLSNQLELSIPICLLLLNRGITNIKEANKFLYPQWEDLHDPFRFKDMQKAVDRIKKAIKKKEKICIYGDYDTDGTTSISLLSEAFKFLGVEPIYYIPNRFKDGYGVNKAAIRSIKEKGTKILITVDCGITSVNEVKLANELGIDVIITDHHLPKEGNFPPAYALITPRLDENEYPYMDLAGVGLAFKLASALIPDKEYLTSLLDLATLGTIVDVAPLTGENRTITKLGLDLLNDPDIQKRPGIKALCSVAGYSANRLLNGYSFSFGLGPRINAAGRMGSADKIVDLLTTKDYDEALAIAMELDQLNQDRKDLEAKIKEDAVSVIRSQKLQNHEGIVIANDWGEKAKGVIGIVAARIMEEFYKPTILLTTNGDELSGSGRCIEGLNLANALTSCSKHLIRYGGHAVAAGLSMKKENLDAFRKDFCKYIRENLSEDYLIPKLEADHYLDLSLIDFDYLNELSLLEPFGNKNHKPKLIASGVEVKESPIPIGKTREHLSLKFNSKSQPIRGLYWRGSAYKRVFDNPSNIFDLVYSPEINEYSNRKNVQIVLEDWKHQSKSKLRTRRLYPEKESKDINLLFKIVDSRGRDKLSYLEKMFSRKEPMVIYVRDKKSKDYLTKNFQEQISVLEKEKIEICITDDIMAAFPFYKHHILCHPVSFWEAFYERCFPAISDTDICGIHLLYNSTDQSYLENSFINQYSGNKFLVQNMRNFLDFQYQKDIKLIWERIQEEYQKKEVKG